ncbi:MAG: hypothetical protein ACREC0_04875 [Methylocella sp.]
MNFCQAVNDVDKKELTAAKSVAPSSERKQPQIFCLTLHHAAIAFGVIVGEENDWIVEEAQRVFLAS